MNKIGCDLALIEASQASSIKLAKTKLNDAIKNSCKLIIAQRQNIGGIWYENLEQQLHTLENINKNATAEEQCYVFKHFKETLKELGH